MENENNNNESKQINQPEGKDKNADAGRKTTAAVLSVALIAGLLTGGGVYKIRHGENSEKTAEVDSSVTTVTSDPDPVYETEETTEEVTTVTTTAETTEEETPAETTVQETEKAAAFSTAVTSVTSSETSVSVTTENADEYSPLRNPKNIAVYSDILAVLPKLERFNFEFFPHVYAMDIEHEYRDIVVGADVTYSFNAIQSIGADSYKPYGGTMHMMRYYKVSELDSYYKYNTEEDVRTALEDYFTEPFIDMHYISNYDEVPGRYTLFKIIDGELYVTSPSDIRMMALAAGNVYNYDGKRCDVMMDDNAPDARASLVHVSLVLEDGKWKIDGYEHISNIPDGPTYFKDLYDKYKDIGKKAAEELKALEEVVFCSEVTTDENDTLTEEYDGTTVVYQRVTDERFSNISEVENFICSLSVADLRLRGIDYIRGVNGKYPVYKMSGGSLYCNKDVSNCKYRLFDSSFSVISADDSFIQIGLGSHSEHNCAFLKNTADGWKLFDLD